MKFKLQAIWDILTCRGFYVVTFKGAINKGDNSRISENISVAEACTIIDDLENLIDVTEIKAQQSANLKAVDELLKA